ncbi:hypothetical protein Bca4012_030281 [Brassica carinata]|uniref:Uncharacterized protein n=2 Tax=Brassica TaxID=3705 RepID=A0A8X7RIY2_BRACI|nr:hypothetical protein Bca52824_048412 [Brassica carinata]CAF1832385.1 unnamed protein product [Brassica napus]
MSHGSGYAGGVGNLAQWPGSCGFVSFLKGCRLWLLRGYSLPHHFEYPCFVSLHNLWGRRRSGFSEVSLSLSCLLLSICLEISFSCLMLLLYGSRVAASFVRPRTRP